MEEQGGCVQAVGRGGGWGGRDRVRLLPRLPESSSML